MMLDGVCYIVFRVILKRLSLLWKYFIDRVFLDWMRNFSREYLGFLVCGFFVFFFKYIIGIFKVVKILFYSCNII